MKIYGNDIPDFAVKKNRTANTYQLSVEG